MNEGVCTFQDHIRGESNALSAPGGPFVIFKMTLLQCALIVALTYLGALKLILVLRQQLNCTLSHATYGKSFMVSQRNMSPASRLTIAITLSTVI